MSGAAGKKIYQLLPLLLLLTITAASADDRDRVTSLKHKALALYPEAVSIRRFLHQNPEIGNREQNTTKYITAYLKALGLEVNRHGETYGVKAVLKGGGDGPVIGIRADMDALPIEEKNDIPFKSKNKGVMHACGHDMHMANAMIAAKIASEMKSRIKGTLVFIFQPCEEGPPPGEKGGASRMIEEGVMENPHIDAMLGLHIAPAIPCGKIGVKEGPMMADVDSIYIDVLGRNAHGANPHNGIDAIYLSSLAIIEFQGLISRLRDPVDPAVLTIGKMEGGERRNVIAAKVHMEGTLRTFSSGTKKMLKEKIEGILKGLKTLYGSDFTLTFVNEAPLLSNDPALFRSVLAALARVISKDDIIREEPQTIAEDFAYFSQKVPSFFFFLGVGGKEKGSEAGLHTPGLMVDEEALRLGPVLMLESAFELMERQ